MNTSQQTFLESRNVISPLVAWIATYVIVIGIILLIFGIPDKSIKFTCVNGFTNVKFDGKLEPIFIETNDIYVPIVCQQ